MLTNKIDNDRITFFSKLHIVFLCFAFWIFAQLLIPLKFLPASVLSQIEVYKTLIPVMGILLCALIYFQKLKFNIISTPFFLFCGFCFIKVFSLMIIAQLPFNILFQTLLYLVWVLVMFVIGPSIFNSLPKLRSLLRYIVVIFSIVIFGVFFFLNNVDIDSDSLYRGGRLTLIYANPLYLGAIAFSLLCCCLLLREFSISTLESFFLLLIALACLLTLVATFSRTFMLATVFLFAAQFYYKSYQSRWFAIGSLLIATIFGLLLILFQFPNGLGINDAAVNSLSSGRIANWSAALENFDSWNILWGNDGSYNYADALIAADDERIESTFQRYAIDNSYIEMFANTGVIGLSLFIWGLVNIFLLNDYINKNISKDDIELRRVVSFAYSTLVSLVVSAFFYGHYPSIGNTINPVVFFPVFCIIFLAYSKANVENYKASK